MGLQLKNPLVVGSSGLTNSISELKEIAAKGAGAVVLKSIFEEQIRHETERLLKEEGGKMEAMQKGFGDIMNSRSYDYAEALNYIESFAKEHTLGDYLKFVSEAKKSIDIPLIASINCATPYDWTYFARRIESAGADALELNVYLLPSNLDRSGEQNEKVFFEIAESVVKQVKIPVAIKLSYYFSGLGKTMVDLSNTGIKGLVLFNRPYHPDINIDTMELTSTHILSNPVEYSLTLRWIAILSGKVGCDLIASTGIHDMETMVKQLMAGANAVQMASVFYKNGFDQIAIVLKDLEYWMQKKGFSNIDEFRGKLSQVNTKNPAAYERVQFMKLYSKII
jgi:dihydroorotate dehydrogenase (fumarate)